jgi:ribosomal protein L20
MASEYFYAKCTVCGGHFETNFFGSRNAKYCSECKKEVDKQKLKEANERRKEKRKKQKMDSEENRPLSLSEIAALARQNGMTYGQFVAKFPNK